MRTPDRKRTVVTCAFVAALGMTAYLAAAPSTAIRTDALSTVPRTWDGGGGDDRWSTAANWVGDVAPANGDDVTISTDGTNPSFYDLASGIRLASVTLVNGAAPEALAIGGDPIRLASGGTLVNNRTGGGNTTSLDVGLNLGGPATVTASAGTSSLTLNNISGTGPLTLVDNTATGAITVAGTGTYSGGARINGTGVVIIQNDRALFGALTVNGVARFATDAIISSLTGTGTVEASGTLTFGDDQTSTTFSGVYRNGGSAASLRKQGAGTFATSGANTYTGATNVDGGTIRAGALNTFSATSTYSLAPATTLALNNFNQTIGALEGGGNVDLGSATLTVGGNNASSTHSGTISGTGNLSKNGTGTLTLTGNNLYSGNTTFFNGAIAIGSSTALGTGGISVQANSTLRAAAAGLSLNNPTSLGLATLTIDTQGNTITHSGFIFGIGGLNKTGPGKLTISGNNTYTGGTSVAGGTIAIASNSALGGDDLSLTGNATLQAAAGGLTLNNAIATGGNVITIDTQSNALSAFGQISGAGTLVKIGSGTLTLMVDNTYSGGTTLGSGAIAIGSNGSLGSGAVTLTGAGSLMVAANALSVGNPVSLGANTLTIDTQGNTYTHTGNITGTGGLSKSGTGTLTLSGAGNTYSGATTVSAGTLRAGAANAFGSNPAVSVVDTATVDLNNFDQTIGSLAGGGSVAIGSATLTVGASNASTTHSGVISGNRLTKTGTGTLTLTGANTHTETVVQSGRVNFNGNQPSTNVRLQGGTAGGTGTIGALTATGGTLAPGLSPGLLTMASMTLSSATTFEVELNGTAAGTQYDQARVTTGVVDLSSATLAGTAGFAPAAGTVFTIIDKQSAGAVAGTFNGLSQGAFVTLGGAQFAVSYTGGDGNDVTLTATGTALVAPATLPAITVGEPFNTTITASGGVAPYTFSVTAGALPAGLTLTAATGVIAGTPTTAGPYNFTITATDSLGVTDTQAYSGTVNAALALAPSTLPAMTVGEAFDVTLSATGGAAPHTYSVTAGTLPAGLTLTAATGVIAGTPTTAGPYSFTVTATDSIGVTDTQAYSGTVNAALALAPSTLPAMTVGEPVSVTFTASGGVGPFTFAVTAGTLPAGLTLNASTGVLSGTPTTAGAFGFTITATDSTSATESQVFSGTVAPAPVPSLPFVGFVILALLLGGIAYARLRSGLA